MRLITVMAPRKESRAFLSRHEWLLALWDKLEQRLDRIVKSDEVEGVICSTRDCSGLNKEMYSEFYTTDADLMHEHMSIIERVRDRAVQILPSPAVRDDLAIFLLKETA